MSLFLFAGVVTAQDDMPEKPKKTGNAKVDGYVDEAFAMIDKKNALAKELADLKSITDTAGVASTSKEDAQAIMKRVETLETDYENYAAEAEKMQAKGETASKATADCGLKAPKCAKAVKNSTKAVVMSTKSAAADAKMAAGVRAKAEALVQATDL